MQRLHITPVVLNLIIINALVFVALKIYPTILPEYFTLEKANPFGLHEEYTQAGHTYYTVYSKGEMYLGPETGKFMPLQIVTSFFSHFEIWHIVLNMLALFQFGTMLEMAMGAKRFLLAYLTIGAVAMALTAFLDPSPIGVIGASGALFGMMVLFAYYFPQQRLGIMFLPFRFPVRKFMIGAAVISAGLIVIEQVTHRSMGGISHFGHLAGMVAGFLYLQAGKLRKLTQK